MTKRTNTKYKLNRRLGENLWGRPKSPVNVRNAAPGQHGARRRKLSDYGTQLMAKQKIRGYYGNIQEKQFRRTFKEAVRLKGDTIVNFVQLLESRLDAVVYRMKFAPTVFSARQLVNHYHVTVNGQKVNIPSYRVKPGDVVEVKQKSKDMQLVVQAAESSEREIPGYMDVEVAKRVGKFVRLPEFDEVPYPVKMEPNLVVEYYSR